MADSAAVATAELTNNDDEDDDDPIGDDVHDMGRIQHLQSHNNRPSDVHDATADTAMMGTVFGNDTVHLATADEDDVENDNGDRLITDFMCDILQDDNDDDEEDDDDEAYDHQDDRYEQVVAESVIIAAAQLQHNNNTLMLDAAIGE